MAKTTYEKVTLVDGVAVYDDSLPCMPPHQEVVPLIKIGSTTSIHVYIQYTNMDIYTYGLDCIFALSTEWRGGSFN